MAVLKRPETLWGVVAGGSLLGTSEAGAMGQLRSSSALSFGSGLVSKVINTATVTCLRQPDSAEHTQVKALYVGLWEEDTSQKTLLRIPKNMYVDSKGFAKHSPGRQQHPTSDKSMPPRFPGSARDEQQAFCSPLIFRQSQIAQHKAPLPLPPSSSPGISHFGVRHFLVWGGLTRWS